MQHEPGHNQAYRDSRLLGLHVWGARKGDGSVPAAAR
jgi:hypothetical protein